MFCPNCGADNQRAEAYCTRCGTWLVDAAQIMRRGRHARTRAASPEQKNRAVLVFNAIGALLSLCAFVLLLARMPHEQPAPLMLAMMFSPFTFAFQLLTFRYSLAERRRLKRGREAALTGQEGASMNDAQVEPRALAAGAAAQFVSPPSVTENTTELLERVPGERGGRG